MVHYFFSFIAYKAGSGGVVFDVGFQKGEYRKPKATK